MEVLSYVKTQLLEFKDCGDNPEGSMFLISEFVLYPRKFV